MEYQAGKFIVFKAEDVRELDGHLQYALATVASAVQILRREKGKSINSYLVINVDEPYIGKVWELMEADSARNS